MSEKRICGPKEVAYLHAFCKKKDIRYIDLRIELVDHLCELVNERWKNHPEESFRIAFHQVYKRFGVFGFMKIADEHERTMQKRYWYEIWLFFKQWITPPKVVLTAVLFSFLFVLGNYNHDIIRYLYAFSIIMLVFSTIISFIQYRRNKRILNELNLLMSGPRHGLFWAIYGCYYIIYYPLHITESVHLLYQPAMVSAILICTLIFCRANYLLLERSKDQLHSLKLKLS
jgi:hypothetical protein